MERTPKTYIPRLIKEHHGYSVDMEDTSGWAQPIGPNSYVSWNDYAKLKRDRDALLGALKQIRRDLPKSKGAFYSHSSILETGEADTCGKRWDECHFSIGDIINAAIAQAEKED